MANETMFVASAVTFLGILAFFVYLHYTSRKMNDWLFERVWMFASFLTVYVSLNYIRRGFQNYVVDNSLADLAFSGMVVLQYTVILVLGWLILTIAYHGFRILQCSVEGKRYEPIERVKEAR